MQAIAAPTTTHAAATTERTPAERSARFVRWLYGPHAGYVEIIAGRADPTRLDKIILDITTRRWLYVHPERPDLYDTLAAYGQQLAHTHGNVYVGVRLYTKQAKVENKRCEAYTLPSTKIFVDDAPADPSLPYSGLVQTSEHSRHGYYECDKPTTKDDARRVAAALGGDPSGIDLTQLVRLVGTFNTKRGGRFAVTGHATNTVYPLADLRAHFPAPVKAQRQAVTPRCTEAAPLLADLFNAERIAAIRTRLDGRTSLLQRANSTVAYITKVPARIKPGTQTYRLLTEAAYRASFRNKGGSWDASLVRYIVCKGLIQVGYDADHIVALLDYLEDPDTQELKGAGNLQGDYARLFLPEKLGPFYTQKQAQQRQYHARQDRPPQHTADSYYTWLQTQQQDGTVPHKRRERATDAGVSTATLDRLEDVLERAGHIRIDTPADRSGSVVVLLGGVIKIVVTEAAQSAAEDVPTATEEVLSGPHDAHVVSGVPAGETANDAPMHKEHTAPWPALGDCLGQDASSASAARGGACVPLAALHAASAPVVPTLRAAVAEAFDACDGGRRLTVKRIVQYLARNYPTAAWVQDPARWQRSLTRQAATERKTRQQQQKLAQLTVLTHGGLKAQLRQAEACADKSRVTGTNAHRWWAFYARAIRQEMQSRTEAPTTVSGPCEALPPLRAVPLTLWTEPKPRDSAEDAWAKQYRMDYEARHAAREAAAREAAPVVDLPPSAPEQAGWALIGRLKARVVNAG